MDLLQPTPASRRGLALAAGLLVLAGLAAYSNSFGIPFVFDDTPSIIDNPTIRQLWPLGPVLSPPHGQGLTVEGRPILNLTIAINYVLGGTRPGGYHAVNLAIHLFAGLVLFGIVRRSLAAIGNRRSLGLALTAALLWTVHPLQTESVTYIIQRAESLMGLLYLLTLYCFIRGVGVGCEYPEAEGRGSGIWLLLCGVSCALGMATKEDMVSAPLLILLYDRTFAAGSFKRALSRHWKLYMALAAMGGWLVLTRLFLATDNRGGTAGFGIDVPAAKYWPTQFQAVVHYVWLSFWPSPLIQDYGTQWVGTLWEVVPYALVVAALAGATLYAVWKKPAAGFLGVWFFAILAPTSIVPGNRQTLAEHRMYLPLASVVILTVCAVSGWIDRRKPELRRVAEGLTIAVALLFCALSIVRNNDYRSEKSLYQDTVAKRPKNAFAHYNLGKILDESGSPEKAIAEYRKAIRLDPVRSPPYNNLGKALADLGQPEAAVEQYRKALELDPNYERAHYNLGEALLALGRKPEAQVEFNAATLLHPDDVEARDNLGGILLETNQIPEAIEQFQAVIRINPNLFETHYMLGNAYLLQNLPAKAASEYEKALRLNPGLKDARANLELAQSKMASH